MAKIAQQPKAPQWPWGGARSVRDKLVDKTQVASKVKKKGDPKNPALASAALLDFIAPAHSAEELRLPMPPMPAGHGGDLEGFLDRPHVSTVAERMSEYRQAELERSMGALRAAPERVERLRSLLQREAQMLNLVSSVGEAMSEVERRRREEQAEEAF